MKWVLVRVKKWFCEEGFRAWRDLHALNSLFMSLRARKMVNPKAFMESILMLENESKECIGLSIMWVINYQKKIACKLVALWKIHLFAKDRRLWFRKMFRLSVVVASQKEFLKHYDWSDCMCLFVLFFNR